MTKPAKKRVRLWVKRGLFIRDYFISLNEGDPAMKACKMDWEHATGIRLKPGEGPVEVWATFERRRKP